MKPTITTRGAIKSDQSALDIERTAVGGEGGSGEPCRRIEESCHWSLVPSPRTAFQEIASQGNGFDVTGSTLGVLGVNRIDALATLDVNCQQPQEGDAELSAELEIAGRLYPADAPGFPEVTISRLIDADFHKLQPAKKVEFKIDLNAPSPSGCEECELTSPDMQSCVFGVTGSAGVTLRRLSLYRNKVAYRR